MRRGVFTIACIMHATLACNASPPSEPAPSVATPSAGTTVRPKVSWPDRADRAALSSLGADASNVPRSPVPVLAPSPARVRLDGPRVMVDAEYYAIHATLAGAPEITIAIQGTRLAHRYEAIAPIEGKQTVRGLHGFVTVNEGIRSASWTENGVSYTLDVECHDPFGDARCTGDAFVLELADSLVYVGGAGANAR
jgi:hypothetical protein